MQGPLQFIGSTVANCKKKLSECNFLAVKLTKAASLDIRVWKHTVVTRFVVSHP